jgi:membrane protease YdiL (CAAX protease family)
LVLLAIGMIFHTIREVSWQLAAESFVLYCFWGLFQQYVLNGYFVNRFSEFLPRRRHAVPALAGVCFSLAHTPNWFLMAIALAGGYLCARIYLKYRNLYLLGLAHGVVGFMIYLVAPDSISHHLYVGPKWYSMR